MYYFVTSSKDSTIYLQQPTQNTGLDEVLEVSKTYYGSLKDISRALIKFETTDFSSSVSDGQRPLDLLYESSQSVQTSLSQSWDSAESSSTHFSASYLVTSASVAVSESVYTDYSASLSVSESNFNTDSSSLATFVSESNTTNINVYDSVSGSVVTLASQSLATSASWDSQSLHESNLSSSYNLISSSFYILSGSSITSSLVDSGLQTEFLEVSESYAVAISQRIFFSSSYVTQSSSVYNQESELETLENHIVSSSESSSFASYRLIPSASTAYTSSNNLYLSASSVTTEASQSWESALSELTSVSQSWATNVSQSSYFSTSFDNYSSSLDTRKTNGDFVFQYGASLLLRECESSEIPLDYTIYAYPVSQSWEMGIGTRFDDITTDGVTWNYRASGSKWLIGSMSLESTGSYNGRGGTWFTGSYGTQSFSYESSDIAMDVKTTLDTWISGTLPNEGFIIKHSSNFENDTVDYGQLKFFSKETHTIHQPKIRLGWDDSVFQTGSLSSVTLTEDITINCKRLKKQYKVNSTPTIEVFARELYPAKTFSNTFAYNDAAYLPTSSFYQVRDLNSNDIIIPFSDYSKLSCNSNGNYFKINLTNFEVNREYKIEFKVERSGSIEYFDDDLTFEVVR